MKVLIAVSSKHGSTKEIAEAVARTLLGAGVEVELVDSERVESIASYDAVVVGSALYMGRWMGPSRALVTRWADELRERRVWLFSSGPLGDVVDSLDAAEGDKLLALVRGREHRVFGGKADKGEFGFVERAIVSMLRAPWGDHRDWAAIEDWAQSIATDLVGAPSGAR